MNVTINPTIHMKKGKLWGFEIQHIISAAIMLIVSNIFLNIINAPLILSWVFAIVTLLALRLLSLGKKAGHLGFLVCWLKDPHLYLGVTPKGKSYATKTL